MLRKLLLTGIFILSASLSVFAQSGTIKGTVTDASTGDVLPGANVYIKSLQQGEYTNKNGNYTINDIPNGTYTLQASFVGYNTFTQQVTVNSGTQTIDISLKVGASLNQVVVTGFGETQSRKSVVSAISTVTADQLQESTTQTLPQSLQGKVAGVQVNATSGALGSPVQVRVRGTSSINASSQPLYVVDGVPLTRNTIGFDLNGENGGGLSPLQNLDPSEIESFTVLKGASATAVYGARGANGVVIVKTKEGQSGKSRVQIGVSGGFTTPTQKYDLVSAKQYANAFNYAVKHHSAPTPFGNVVPFSDNGFFPAPGNLTDSDWPGLVTRTGNIQNYQASVSGGNDNTTFYVHGSYRNKHGYAVSNQLQNYNVLGKVNHQFNDQLDVGLSLNVSRGVNNQISQDNSISAPYTYAALEPPVVPRYLPDGTVNDGISQSDTPLNFFSFPGTPLSNQLGIFRDATTTNIKSNAFAAYDILPTLTLKTQFSVQSLQTQGIIKRGKKTTDGAAANGAGIAQNDQYLNYNWRNTLKYVNDWNNNSLNVLLGVTFQRSDQTGLSGNGNSFPSSQLLYLDAASNFTNANSFRTDFAFQNNIARITYQYKQRYILTLSGSYEGSSRFSENDRYGFFPSVAAGWVISDENFAQSNVLSNLKLHASYGQVGNASIGNYPSLALLGAGANYNSNPGISLTQLQKDLTWEATNELDIGLDYGFINNRVRGTLSFYRKQTSDDNGLLLSVPVSATNGFTSILRNTGTIRNQGVEFDVTANIIQNKKLNWQVNANISANRNKVISIPSAFNAGSNHRVEEGKPLGYFYLPEYAGVNPNNGDALYYVNQKPTQDQISSGAALKVDKFGDRYVTHNPNLAKRIDAGNPTPDFYGGFGTRVNFLGIDASVDFTYQKGSNVYWDDGTFLATNFGATYGQSADQLDYWTKNNTDASIPEARYGGNGNAASTRYLLDSSFLRLKNATIGYTLPAALVNGYKVRVYVQGQNLATISPYRGLDPEVTINREANAQQGFTFFQLPQPKSVIFGIQLGF